MKVAALLLCVSAYSSVLFSQSSLTDGQSVLGKGLWSQNVAGNSHASHLAVGISNDYAFGLSELSTSKIAALAPFRFGTLTAEWSNVGDELYAENELALSLSRNFASYFQLGMQMRYHTISIQSESRSSLLVDVGMQSAITDDISFGVQLENPLRSAIEPTALEIGVGYWLSKKASLILSAKKESDLPTSVLLHINYSLLENLSLQGALSNTAYFNHFAFSYKLKGFTLDVFLSHHSYLGYSPKVGISYSLAK